uniref:DDE Tnp4 domain-containing protein n=1 Tax=Anopheles funestus TaxID=62324 RepID=A0A182RJW4_ANOFN
MVTCVKGLEEKWNFPHAIGAMDGKHVSITSPHNTGTDNYNYKKNFCVHQPQLITLFPVRNCKSKRQNIRWRSFTKHNFLLHVREKNVKHSGA